jgi:hypothetical protein
VTIPLNVLLPAMVRKPISCTSSCQNRIIQTSRDASYWSPKFPNCRRASALAPSARSYHRLPAVRLSPRCEAPFPPAMPRCAWRFPSNTSAVASASRLLPQSAIPRILSLHQLTIGSRPNASARRRNRAGKRSLE